MFIGLGSIGKRHLTNAIALGYNNIVAVSSKAVALSREYPGIVFYTDFEQALSEHQFSAAIICTPTAQHNHYLRRTVVSHIAHIYLEKPVSHNFEQIPELLALVAGSSSRVVVGYDLHFDPGLQKVKELIAGNAIGRVLSVNAQVGQYLPDWRPHEDYRQGMSAKKATGGGVMLDLVHEFDYVYWLLGPVLTIASFSGQLSDLEIETEDVAEVLLRFESGAIGTIHLDYLQQQLIRNCLVTGCNGSILWNLVESQVLVINERKESQQFNYSGFQRNDRFVEILKAFLSAEPDYRLCSFESGVESLKMVLAAKESNDKNTIINLRDFI